MTASIDPAATLERNYDLIRGICSTLAFRNGLEGAEGDDFTSWAVEQLVDDDYSAIRRFGNEGPFRAYLNAVLLHLCHDYRNRFWGRWRPSASARRLGAVAVRLERMVYRDRRPVAEAVASLKAAGAEIDVRSAHRVLAQLPVRWARTTTPLEPDSHAGSSTAEEGLADSLRSDALDACRNALEECLAELGAEDRVIIQLHYWSGRSVADIARILHLEQKPLYRRLEALRRTIRSGLERRGITAEDIAMVLDAGDD